MTTTYDTVHNAADALARQLVEEGYGSVDLQPGNMTRYEVVVVDDSLSGFVVALPDFGSAYRFGGLAAVHPSYVSEKLRLGQVDAEVVAELLGLTAEEMHRLTAPVLLGTLAPENEYGPEHDGFDPPPGVGV